MQAPRAHSPLGLGAGLPPHSSALTQPPPRRPLSAVPQAPGVSPPATWVKSHSRCAGRATSSHFLSAGMRALPSSTRHLESGRKAVEPRGPSCSRPSVL